MKLGKDTGSLVNHVYGTAKQPEPKVGMGVTVLKWSDRQAGTIIKVTPKTVTVQWDKATRVDLNGRSEMQTYEYAPDPNGIVEVFRMTKRGWRGKAGGLLLGHRDHYHDYSF